MGESAVCVCSPTFFRLPQDLASAPFFSSPQRAEYVLHLHETGPRAVLYTVYGVSSAVAAAPSRPPRHRLSKNVSESLGSGLSSVARAVEKCRVHFSSIRCRTWGLLAAAAAAAALAAVLRRPKVMLLFLSVDDEMSLRCFLHHS